MTTLNILKRALKQEVDTVAPSPSEPLSETQYSDGNELLLDGSGWNSYQNFIIPQLSQLLATLLTSRVNLSVLEIGPGPESIFGRLPFHLRRRIGKYTAFEPNSLFHSRLQEWLSLREGTEVLLPSLEGRPTVHRRLFSLSEICTDSNGEQGKYDMVLFCHSMYGMKPKRAFIERALKILVEEPGDGMVVVFHRGAFLDFDGLVCHRTASFPTGTVSIPDVVEMLDTFASFIAGSALPNTKADLARRSERRKVCRALGRRDEAQPGHLTFTSPEVMVAFDRNAIALPELTAKVPLVAGDKKVKSWEARLHQSAAIVRPEGIEEVQECIRWALYHKVSLAVMGGGHSGHCLWPHIVSVNMSAFDRVHILKVKNDEGNYKSGSLIVAESGCKTGDIIHKSMEEGLIVPLGARPSIGAGLWLQGGIGHLKRQYGLSCDSIVGAVLVGVDCGQVYCIGTVPREYTPEGAVRPLHEADLLWAIKGAGTNFGIVISVTFKAYPAPIYSVRNWVVPLRDSMEMQFILRKFDNVAAKLERCSSADAYLYYENGQIRLGVTVIETSMPKNTLKTSEPTPMRALLGPENSAKTEDSIGLFDSEMYISGMHGGHGGGKTSSLKRCVFLKGIGAENVAKLLAAAIETRPTALSYLHLLQGGGAVQDMATDGTAFGCRDWDFACVITGVWPCELDETETAEAAMRWVRTVAEGLLPFSTGAYGADLGPDPRDAVFAEEAFGPNKQRLGRLKGSWDPHNVLAYSCPLPKTAQEEKSKLIFLVTGDDCVGKDTCAGIWVSFLTRKCFRARAVSISEDTKREYAAVAGADFDRLLGDRAYKEQHRPALTTFFQGQVRQRPQLPAENFLRVVKEASEVDVLFITGMRGDAPVSTVSYLVPDRKVLEIRVQARNERWQAIQGNQRSNVRNEAQKDWRPDFVFSNDTPGSEEAERFGEAHLLPFLHDDLQRLASMVRQIPNFPSPGVDFHHVLGIAQHPGGLSLCTSLLKSRFRGDWSKFNAVACCEAGGFVFASPVALFVDVPLLLMRQAGKLPPPTVSTAKPTSYIGSLGSTDSKETRLEMERDVLEEGASVVIVDDVLSTGETLCAVLQLLIEAGVEVENVSVMVVAEFPIHRGRQRLRQRGFGKVNVQSLLVFGSA